MTNRDQIARMSQDFTPPPLSGRKCQFSGEPIELCEVCRELDAQSGPEWLLVIIVAVMLLGGWLFWGFA